jgi:hypothetical protein
MEGCEKWRLDDWLRIGTDMLDWWLLDRRASKDLVGCRRWERDIVVEVVSRLGRGRSSCGLDR